LNQNEILIAKKPETIAGFWSVKEAFSKALGCGIGKELNFTDIEVYKDEKNAPYIKINPDIIEKFNIKSTSLSISHDGGFAIAVVAID
jgi:holo-[acyl-carrier protein] synthase